MKAGYYRRLSIAKSIHGECCSISPPGASIPAPAELASPPIRQAIEAPMMPAPAMIASNSTLPSYAATLVSLSRAVKWQRAPSLRSSQ